MSSTSRALRVAVIDDHAVVREGTEAIIDRQPDMRVVASAGSLDEFHRSSVVADVVLLDLDLGEHETGFRLLEEYSTLDRQQVPAVVVLSAFDYPQYVRAALDLGAAGYVLKMAPVAELIDAVRRAGRGLMSFGVRPPRAIVALTPREEQVVAAVADGLSNDEIGVRLGISARTVASHLRRLYERLGVSSRAELAARSVREGWLRPPGAA